MSNDNEMPPPPPGQLHPDFGDPELLFNMRAWLQKACEDARAKMTGGGIGMGEADIDIDLDGHLFNISIRPIVAGS